MQSIKIRLKPIGIALCTSTLFLAGCSNLLPNKQSPKESSFPSFSFPFGSPSLDDYKKTVAQRIISDNSNKTYSSRPQALLRAVIVLKFRIDANGRLLHS
ncbi:MAG: hypothetical protein NWQ13_01695, partial [Glaciimonas sp.]|nr:hypothetical protein [Glaciimonas sp.]